MSRGNSRERACMMSALGAEVVIVDQSPNSEIGKVSGEDLEQYNCSKHLVVEKQ